VTYAERIEQFFLNDGKWDLEVVPEGHPNSIPGRWLWLSDANYGFRPADLAKAIMAREANQEKAK
jgi:hypothetical protein